MSNKETASKQFKERTEAAAKGLEEVIDVKNQLQNLAADLRKAGVNDEDDFIGQIMRGFKAGGSDDVRGIIKKIKKRINDVSSDTTD